MADADAVARTRIEHVVVLMLENRSFDHLFGFLDHPSPDFPSLRGKQFPNPHDLTERNGTTADVSDDAEPVLAVDPPHGHLGAKTQMNGRRWRAFLMNGFVSAYAQKLAGKEPIPIVHWARVNGFLVLLSPLFASALAGLWRRIADGDVVGFLLGWFVPGVLVVAGVVRGLQIDRLLGWRWRKLLVPVLVAGFALAAVAEGAVRLLADGWDGLTPWLVGVVVVIVPVVWRQARKMKQRARVPASDVRTASERVMRCMPPERIPVMATLAKEFAVCTAWFSSVPGATWPNRNFAHAGTSDETVDIEIGFYEAPTVFEVLASAHPATRPWHIYYDGRAQLLAFNRLWTEENAGNWYPMKRFFEHVADDRLPMYSFVEPRHSGPRSNSQHPGNNEHETAGSTDFERGEDLVRRMYEALRANPAVFEKTLFVITYDEHGGLFDHVPPPRAKHPTPMRYARRRMDLTRRIIAFFVENRKSPFDFRCYGPRVPAVVVSPWIERGTIDDTLYDHASIVATVRALFAPAHPGLTRRDRFANSLLHLVAGDRATPRQAPPLPAAVAAGRPGVSAEAEPEPGPPAHTPTMAADLRDQLPALEQAMAPWLPGDADADPMDRFEAWAEQHRG